MSSYVNTPNAPKFLVNLFALPVDLLLSRKLSGRALLRLYLDKPEMFWWGPSLRHAEKVRKAVASLGERDAAVLSDLLFEQVEIARREYNRPVFVMGCGGSGSTWIGAMLGDLPGFVYGREIYIPRRIARLVKIYRSRSLENVVWSLMLLHSCGLNSLPINYGNNFVNSARSVNDYSFLKRIWPDARFVVLVRDPRDQILSVTYRKQKYREVVAPGWRDMEYVEYNAKKFMKTYRSFNKLKQNGVVFIKYEDVLIDTQSAMVQLAARLQLEVADEDIRCVVLNNDASLIRAGVVEKRGNLDEGGISLCWQKSITCKEKERIKPIIQEALLDLEYESTDRW